MVGKKDIRLLDSKRAYNVEIILSKFREFKTYESLGEAIESRSSLLTSDMLLLLKTIYPSDTDQAAVKRYRGDQKKLGKAEQFMLSIAKVPRAMEKIECSLFVSEFESQIKGFSEKIDVLLSACENITSCEPLVNVL